MLADALSALRARIHHVGKCDLVWRRLFVSYGLTSIRTQPWRPSLLVV